MGVARTETASRQGDRFRIFLTEPAFKFLNRRLRNLLFGPRQSADMKGIVVPIAVRELVDSFVDPANLLAPDFVKDFGSVARRALRTHSFALWIYSCLQALEEGRSHRVSDDALSLCEEVLSMDPGNAVALYFAGQGRCERGDPEAARAYLEDLTSHWPTLADGWLELGRLLKRLGDEPAAGRALLQARRYGASEDKELESGGAST